MSRATSFANACLVAAASAGILEAQMSGEGQAVPVGLRDRVAQNIAAIWQVSPQLLQLQWGRLELDQLGLLHLG